MAERKEVWYFRRVRRWASTRWKNEAKVEELGAELVDVGVIAAAEVYSAPMHFDEGIGGRGGEERKAWIGVSWEA